MNDVFLAYIALSGGARTSGYIHIFARNNIYICMLHSTIIIIIIKEGSVFLFFLILAQPSFLKHLSAERI